MTYLINGKATPVEVARLRERDRKDAMAAKLRAAAEARRAKPANDNAKVPAERAA